MCATIFYFLSGKYDKSIVFQRSGHIFQSPEGDASGSGGETAAEEVTRPKFESYLGGSIGCQDHPRMTTDPRNKHSRLQESR